MENLININGAGCGSLNSNKRIPYGPIERAAILIDHALQAGVAATWSNGSLTVGGKTVLKHACSGAFKPTKSLTGVTNQIQFDGKRWTFRYAGQTVHDTDLLGWHYVSKLVENADLELHVTNLVTAVYGEPVEIMTEAELVEDGVAVDVVEDSAGEETPFVDTAEYEDEILPDDNRGFVCKLLEEKYEQLEILKSKGLPCATLLKMETAQQVESDIKKVEAYLKKYRFFGRKACYSNRTERDRKSVTKAIDSALKKFAAKHPVLAEHFTKSIHKGEFCEYRQPRAVCWKVAICARK